MIPEPGTTLVLTDRRWRTELVLSVRGADALRHEPAVRSIFAGEVERLERVASRFRDDSELSVANQRAGQWVSASPLLIELVEVAVAAAEQSDGLVSPCVGHQVDAAGYQAWAEGQGPGRPVRTTPAPQLDPGAWQRLEVGPARVRVPAGVQVDLGATAKAWLADELAERVADETGLDVVANMGGDLRAIGSSQPWVVGAAHDASGLADLALGVTDAGLATSGIGRRRWLTPTGLAHHVIDPRTGLPASTRWWSVSVLASCATAANTASTAALILDGAAPGWLGRRALSAALTAWDGKGPSRRVLVGDWPGQEGRAA